MRVDYEPVQKKWEAAHAAWRAEKKRRDNEAFKLSRTPSERAALDPERFLAMYFLTDGRPDATKVRKALALHNVQNVRKFEKMAKKTVPGLYTWNGPDRFASNVYIGWDIDEVVDLGMRTSKDEEKANKAQQKALWEQQLERHREYVAQARVGEPSKGPKKHPEGFSLDRCKGSYVIHCKETTEEYLSILKGHTLTMDIWSRDETTLCAAFDFGILEGTMILGMTEDLLKDDPFESDQDLEARFSDEDVDEIDPEEEIRRFQISANRRKRKATEAELAELAAKRQAKEMRRAAEPVPEFLQRRVYFRLRSRLTAVGDINPAPEAGHLDFRSDDCVEFSGRVYLLSWIGKNVWFRGHKVSDTPRVEPEDWSSFPIKSGFKYIQSDVKNL
ncbi:uncharacterized protein Triagg1_227 [Trichoderma aggressivum f. europaeum]|uniref:Uncharacterized protein n=1 Tax=Trichoderma aggressivum f. europaeum TaxID=173218 RepID=A0AAE1M3S8_9HYPO|nr:hypothetical protein Triagg1_227 [Trichoderma aggressivum f. europaeum]